MSDIQIQQVLSQMRALQSRAGQVQAPAESQQAGGVNFTRVLQQSLQQVNQAQQTSGHLATRFEQGAPEVSLTDVVLAQQRASLQFEAVTQVRNRLVAAYQEIMNMQV
jgi:flagellar hook-basal body complex protein FliE